MRNKMTIEEVFERALINIEDEGIYIQEFFELYSKKVGRGLDNVHWYFKPKYDELNSNEKAKILLAFDWACENASSKIRRMDGFGKWYQFHRNFDVVLDKFDSFRVSLFKKTNPYAVK